MDYLVHHSHQDKEFLADYSIPKALRCIVHLPLFFDISRLTFQAYD